MGAKGRAWGEGDRRQRTRAAILVATTALVGLAILTFSSPGRTSTTSPGGFFTTESGISAPAPSAAAPASGAPPATSLTLGITASPRSLCAFNLATCAAGVGTSRVTLTASAGSSGVVAWPAVQVAFVIETTSYDGVYDSNAGDPGNLAPPGQGDSCAVTGTLVCEESNGVPFFVANAQSIADSIQSANPHSQVSFALVDYFATVTNWDDGDGAEYHVDIPQFVPTSYFGADVQSTFQATVLGGGFIYGDSDLSDNQLHSSSITALYGTIIGSGLDWSNDTHHVIVWMGSTAPRDPNYLQDACIGPQDQSYSLSEGCYTSSCEPAYRFSAGTSPNCEGWVKSQDGSGTDSIAGLAHTAKTCTDSIGGVCTVDTIDLWTTPTDPLSAGWPSHGNGHTGGGPGGSLVQQNVARVLLAGCDLAAATGGSWSGPTWFTCPDGQAGSLEYVPHGQNTQPETVNPTLADAFRRISFGPVLETQVASGSGRPIFQFVPYGNIALAPNLEATASCLRNGVLLSTCQTQPARLVTNGLSSLGWNWSRNASTNEMYVGDSWTASFNVIATGPPYTVVPVDACTTTDCAAAGSGAVLGLYTSATYVPFTNDSVVTQSFPLSEVNVLVTSLAPPPPTVPPPAPPLPPGFPVPAPTPLPVVQQIGIGNSVGVANLSLQATAAGFLGAGFMRVGVKNRPMAMKIAAKSGVQASKFDAGPSRGDPGLGRFE